MSEWLLSNPQADLILFVIVFFCIALGWNLHATWMKNRLTVKPIYNQEQKIVGYVVHLGRAHMGRYPTKDRAQAHLEVVWKAIRGHR